MLQINAQRALVCLPVRATATNCTALRLLRRTLLAKLGDLTILRLEALALLFAEYLGGSMASFSCWREQLLSPCLLMCKEIFWRMLVKICVFNLLFIALDHNLMDKLLKARRILPCCCFQILDRLPLLRHVLFNALVDKGGVLRTRLLFRWRVEIDRRIGVKHIGGNIIALVNELFVGPIAAISVLEAQDFERNFLYWSSGCVGLISQGSEGRGEPSQVGPFHLKEWNYKKVRNERNIHLHISISKKTNMLNYLLMKFSN